MNDLNVDPTQPTPVGDDSETPLEADQTQPVAAHPADIEQAALHEEPLPLQVETSVAPVELVGENDAAAPSEPDRRKIGWGWWLLLAILVFGGILALSTALGYQQGIAQRQANEATQAVQTLAEQFQLAEQDMAAGRYEIARQRLDYIIGLQPDYPGAVDRLAEVLLIINVTATPTLAPTATPVPMTPTPDLRGEVDLYNQAVSHVANQQWTDAIVTLETLRKRNPDYKAVDLDGMFYVAYRNRGIEKITQGNLEGGIYDLSLAERFGILDTEADGWRTWARYYITGASFWGIDWGQAVYYFSQVAPMTPNLHDGSGWTAAERYYEAVLNYAEYLEDVPDWCGAEEYFRLAYDLSGDETLQEAIQFSAERCNPVEEAPPEAEEPTPEATPEP
ncbi:MAG: hypothetical protein JW862_10825 [Anaerolineales bacterium]|nr:hypothetical protein [Anaerolineales bacterium]